MVGVRRVAGGCVGRVGYACVAGGKFGGRIFGGDGGDGVPESWLFVV